MDLAGSVYPGLFKLYNDHRQSSLLIDDPVPTPEPNAHNVFSCLKGTREIVRQTVSERIGVMKNRVGTVSEELRANVSSAKDGLRSRVAGVASQITHVALDLGDCLDPLGLAVCFPSLTRTQPKKKEVDPFVFHSSSEDSLFYNASATTQLHYSPNVVYVEDEPKDEEVFATWECDFYDFLDDLGISRKDFLDCLFNVVLTRTRHPTVDSLLRTFREKKGLDAIMGETLLYHVLGRAYLYDLDNCHDNLQQVVKKHVKVQEAIRARLEACGVDYADYDELEDYIWAFCENKPAPRKVHDLELCLEDAMNLTDLDFLDVQDIFGPANLLVQVGPHASIVQTHQGEVHPVEEFFPLDNAAQYSKFGKELCQSHWGPVYKLGDFNGKLVVKVIDRLKWERKRDGLDRWNDDPALEIQTHRFLTNVVNHPNLVRFEAVTMDTKSIYYYQEAGEELFGCVEKHRQRYWLLWQKSLAKRPCKYYLDHKSPWEERAVKVFSGIFKAVSCLHERRIVHRDIKLENMVCVGNDGSLQGKLIDFGVTLRMGEWEKSCKNVGKVGTYPFFSPEMCYNKRPHQAARSKIHIDDLNSFDARLNDIWCLGHALWGYTMGVLLFQDISATDARFTVATKAKFSSEPEKWQGKHLGLRYLAKRYGAERNHMATAELIDLLEHMLAPEAERYTAAQCLNHPWFQNKTPQLLESSSPNSVPKLV